MPTDKTILLLGSTDLTIAVAEAVREAGVGIAGIVSSGDAFKISYAPGGVRNSRAVDLPNWGAEHGVELFPYDGVGALAELSQALVHDRNCALCLAAGWYHMVPASVRDLFPLGAAGLHASLLPKLRGGAPLNWAILSGLTETGITLFELSDGVDDGRVWGQARFPIGERDDVGVLVERSREASRTLIAERLPGILDGSIEPIAQEGDPSFALQRNPDDGRIDWRRSAAEIDRLVRAVARPYPGAWTLLADAGPARKLLIWKADVVRTSVLGAPGQIYRSPSGDIGVITSDGMGGEVLMIRDAEFEDTPGENAAETLKKLAQRRLT